MAVADPGSAAVAYLAPRPSSLQIGPTARNASWLSGHEACISPAEYIFCDARHEEVDTHIIRSKLESGPLRLEESGSQI